MAVTIDIFVAARFMRNLSRADIKLYDVYKRARPREAPVANYHVKVDIDDDVRATETAVSLMRPKGLSHNVCAYALRGRPRCRGERPHRIDNSRGSRIAGNR